MKVRDDVLQVSAVPFDHEGNKLEPEQQMVRRTIITDLPATGTLGAETTIQGRIVTDMNVMEYAKTVGRLCGSCKHFDREEWQKFKRKADDPTAPMEFRVAMNETRAFLLETSNANIQDMHRGLDGDMDVEAALNECGFCPQLTDLAKDFVVVHASSSCPPEVVTPDKPNGLFEPLDRSAQRLASGNYDKMMKMAEGKLKP